MSTHERSVRPSLDLRSLVDRTRWLPEVVVAAPVVLAVGVCLFATKRGFDYTDEGLALLSAQHPLEYLRSTTQAQLVWAPILDLVGSVQLLRIVKLVALLGSSVFFAMAFVRAFRLFTGRDCDTRDRLAVAAAVAAGGLMLYVWLPQTPGYNELATISTALIVGIVLWLWAGTGVDVVEQRRLSRRTVQLAGFAVGVLACALALAKWSGAIAIVPVALVAAIDKRVSLRQAVAWLRWVVAGAAVGLIAIQTMLAPLPDIAHGIRQGFGDIKRTHGVRLLWTDYPGDFLRLGKLLVKDYWPMLVVAVLIGVALGRRPSARAGQALALGIGAFGVLLWRRGWADGGTFNLDHSSAIIPSLLVSVAVAGVIAVGLQGRLRRLPLTRAAALLSLALVPILSSVGTNNTIQYIAMLMSGCWIAVIFAMVVGSAGSFGRVPLQTLAIVLVLLVAYMVVDGTWRKPYQQPPLSSATVTPSIAGAGRDLTLSQQDATFLERADVVVRRLGGGARINMIALWTLSGVPALVGSVQPTFGYLPKDEVDRAAHAVRDGCRDESKPLLLLEQELPHFADELQKVRGACTGRSWRRLESIPMTTTQFSGIVHVWLAAPRPAK